MFWSHSISGPKCQHPGSNGVFICPPPPAASLWVSLLPYGSSAFVHHAFLRPAVYISIHYSAAIAPVGSIHTIQYHILGRMHINILVPNFLHENGRLVGLGIFYFLPYDMIGALEKSHSTPFRIPPIIRLVYFIRLVYLALPPPCMYACVLRMIHGGRIKIKSAPGGWRDATLTWLKKMFAVLFLSFVFFQGGGEGN